VEETAMKKLLAVVARMKLNHLIGAGAIISMVLF
jgi:hypothetical protein